AGGVLRWSALRRLESAVKRRFFGEYYVDPETVAVPIAGVRLYLPRDLAGRYQVTGYEPLARRAFLQALRPGMTVVDVGASVGFYTVLAANAVGPTGTVHA